MKLLSSVKSFFGVKLRSEEPTSEEPEVVPVEEVTPSKIVQTSRNAEGAYRPRFYRRR